METLARSFGLLNVLLALTGAAGVAILALSGLSIQRFRLRPRFEGEPPPSLMTRLQQKLDEAELGTSAPEFLRSGISLGATAAALSQMVFGFPVLTIMLFLAGIWIHWAWLESRRDRKRREYLVGLAEGVDLIRDSYLVIPALRAVFQMIADSGPPVIRGDFQRITAGLAAGATMQEVLHEVCERRRNPLLDQMAETILVQDREGGELSEVLRRMAESIREQIRIQQRIDAEQLRQRWTGRLVAVFPFVALFILRVIAPEYVVPFYTTALGQVVLVLVALLSLGGYWMMNRLAVRGLTVGRVTYQ